MSSARGIVGLRCVAQELDGSGSLLRDEQQEHRDVPEMEGSGARSDSCGRFGRRSKLLVSIPVGHQGEREPQAGEW